MRGERRTFPTDSDVVVHLVGPSRVLSHMSILGDKSDTRISATQWLTDSKTLEKAHVRQNRCKRTGCGFQAQQNSRTLIKVYASNFIP